MRLRTDKAGLDRPPFTSLAIALNEYVVALREYHNSAGAIQYQARLDALSEQLAAYVKEPAAEPLKKIGADLDWLVERRQALELVDSITRQLSQPNLYVSVAEDFLAAGMNRTIDETTPVRDVILGTRIVGSGRTRGDVTFRLVPNADVAMLEATLEGVNHSKNVGYNGPAIIHSVGTTRLLATKWLSIDVDGVHGHKATAGADTSDAHYRHRLIEAGRHGACGRAGRAEAGSAAKVRGRIDRRGARRSSRRTTIRRADRQGVARTRICGSKSASAIHWSAADDCRTSTSARQRPTCLSQRLWHTGRKLAAQGEPPELVQPAQISLRLHESLVNNFTAGELAGQTIGQPELENFAKEFLGEVPERIKDDPDKEPWTITFADEEPVVFAVSEGGFMFKGRGKKYTSGSRSFPAMDFTVKYKLEKMGQGVKGTRIGDIEIFPPGFVPGGDRRLSLPQVTLRRLMMRRLEKIFDAEIVKPEATELKNEWKAAGPLEVTDLTADRGWLSVGWRQAQPANTAQAPTGQSATLEVAR